MIRGIILAAGASARMGAPKALLSDGNGRVFVTRLLHSFAAAGVCDVAVVTGTVHAEIVRAVSVDAPRGLTVRFARNTDPARGQLSSVITGLDAVNAPGVRAVLMTPVDVPFVRPATIAALVTAYRTTSAAIVRPAIGGRHGHPVLFDSRLFDELRQADPALGAKAVVRAHAREITNVEVDDEGAIHDVDTRLEYERTIRQRQARPVPNPELPGAV